jgi:hypothetical protein
MKKSIIEFIDVTNEVPDIYAPKPAKMVIPDWYKNISSYIDGVKEAYADDRGFSSSTIKKCMPVYDALTAGYIIFSSTDVEVSSTPEGKYYKWPARSTISFHDPSQASTYPNIPRDLIPKWQNPWAIRTPRGYSCLFVNPFNRGEESVFHCFEGVVDTDDYVSPVNFPFLLKDQKWEGVIPAGTPIVQVIPFKRESYSHAVMRRDDLKNNVVERVTANLKSTFFNGYKDRFWNKKEYN